MESWIAPVVPRLPGQGPQLRVFDTATQELRPVAPGPVARMYVCGITPYDATHLGHAATYLTFDLVHRVWLDAGHEVHYVQNVTDVDDPLLERAIATGQDWREVARRETELFRTDMTALGVIPPQDYIGAVEAIPAVVALVERLLEGGSAYRVDDDIYFAVHADPRFGSVANLDEAEMLALFGERGGDPDRAGKKHPLDCLLWQGARPDEPSWETSLGAGRPGWHIECAAISLEHLGVSFDVQGGGRDLAFPHHEMSASEGQVVTETWPYARTYVHAGLVGLDGEKMSKSRGNLVFVSKLREAGVEPVAIRLALLGHHYRTDWEWTDADLVAAQDRLTRWREVLDRPSGPPSGQLLHDVRTALADDLNAPSALHAVDRWVEDARLHGGDDPEAPAEVRALLDALLGLSV